MSKCIAFLFLCLVVVISATGSQNNDQVTAPPALVTSQLSENLKGQDKVPPETHDVPSNNDATNPSVITEKPTSTTDAKTDHTTVTSTPAHTTITHTTTTTAKTTTIKPTPPQTSTAPPAPVTTPAPPPTTVAPPQPQHPGKWMVNGTNITCIVVQMAVQLNVTYDTINKTKAYKVFDMPSNSTQTIATGNCGTTEQNITLSWNSLGKAKDNFTLHFVKNDTTKQYSLHHFEVALTPQDLPMSNSNHSMILIHNASLYSTGLSSSYRCFRLQTLNLTHNGTVTGQLKLTDLQFQAFRSDNSTVFGLAKDCAFDTPDIVPIAVGCALAGLVIIILIAYLVGRRRCQSHGYLSM